MRDKEYGVSRLKERLVWANIKDRCYRTTHPQYHNYGGRGIVMCERWLNSFDHFFEDMGFRPEGYQIDRIDNDGNYEPTNCKWRTRLDNMRNKTQRKVNPSSLTQIAKRIGMAPANLIYRVNVLKWSLEDAIIRPIKKYTRRSN